MSSAFIQAAVILLREGLEAMLVIAALAGYLVKVGGGHRVRALYAGALAAIGASIVAAWLFAVLNSGEHSDILEGVIILVAAALLTAHDSDDAAQVGSLLDQVGSQIGRAHV